MFCCQKPGDQDLPLEATPDKDQHVRMTHNLTDNAHGRKNEVVELVKVRVGTYSEHEVLSSLADFSDFKKTNEVHFEEDTELKSKVFNNSVYSGQAVRGKSMGMRDFKDGTLFEGEALDCGFDGIGRIIHCDGDVYQGQFKENVAQGWGEWHGFNGDVYKGTFKDNLAHGQGHYTHKHGITYKGDFAFGTFNGQGELIVPDKYVYTGLFIDGAMNERGELDWFHDDRNYKGGFVKGKFHGRNCTYTDQRGNIYSGDFKNGLRHSHYYDKCDLDTVPSTYYAKHLDVNYICAWRNGKMDGEIKITRSCEPYEVLFSGYIKDDRIVSKDEYYYKAKKDVPVVHEVKVVEPVKPKMTRINTVRLFYELRTVNRNVEAAELLTDDCFVSPPIGWDIKTKPKILEYWESKRNDPQPELTMQDPVELREQNSIYRLVSMKKFFLTITMKMQFWFREDGLIEKIKVSKA